MRITDIYISNYRQYQEIHLEFPKNKEHDLHVIVAQNGIGKTNLLNAINWCLYGDEPHLGDVAKSLPKFNLEAKRQNLSMGITKAEIVVKIIAEDDMQHLEFSRSLLVKLEDNYEYEPEFSVSITFSSGDTDIYENNDADVCVDRYMPKKIRQYFYFDGEQLHNYFTGDNNTNIKETIHAISQVDIVTRVKERLTKITSDKAKGPGNVSDQLDLVNKDISKCEKRIKEIEDLITELDDQIRKSTNIIKVNTEHLQGKDNLPELEAKYAKLKQRLNDLESESDSIKSDIFKFLKEYKIILSFYPSAERTLTLIKDKESKNLLPPNIDKNLLLSMLQEHRCKICDHELTSDDEAKIQQIIQQIQVSSATSNRLMAIKSELARVVNAAPKYPGKKEDILERKKRNEDNLAEVGKELQDIDNQISKFSDKEQVKKWHHERDEHEKLKIDNLKKQGQFTSEYNNIKVKLDDHKIKRTSILAKMDVAKRMLQLLEFATKSQEIVASIEQEMMDEVKTKMATSTTEYFHKLIWKKNTYSCVTLNENYELDLIHRDDYSCVGSCSAAERALLALSFTLALHKVSGFDSLLFIDTPVARVSDQNRVNFAEVLCEVSKDKQIIMTFTPDEYSSEIKNIFEPAATSSATLNTVNEDATIYNRRT